MVAEHQRALGEHARAQPRLGIVHPHIDHDAARALAYRRVDAHQLALEAAAAFHIELHRLADGSASHIRHGDRRLEFQRAQVDHVDQARVGRDLLARLHRACGHQAIQRRFDDGVGERFLRDFKAALGGVEIGVRHVQVALEAVEGGLGDKALGHKVAVALEGLPGILVLAARRQHLPARLRHLGLVLGRIDAHDDLAGAHGFALAHQHLLHLARDLGLDRGLVERPQPAREGQRHAQVLRGGIDQVGLQELHQLGRPGSRGSAVLAVARLAYGGSGAEHGNHRDGGDRGDQDFLASGHAVSGGCAGVSRAACCPRACARASCCICSQT